MYCRKCGGEIESDSLFCKHCGVEVNAEKSVSLQDNDLLEEEFNTTDDQHSERHSQDREVNKIENKQPSMKWYKALTVFFIPAALILRPIETLGNLHLNMEHYYGSWGNYFTHSVDGIPNALNIILWLFGMVLLLIAYKGIKKFTELGYKCIMAYFIFNAVYPVLAALIYAPSYSKVGIDFNYGPIVAQFILSLVVSIPNLIYFRKRKNLFLENRVHNV